MGLIIEDGKGSGQTAEVKNNKLEVWAVSVSSEHHINLEHGEAYNALFAVNPDGADDCIFYLKNTDTNIMIIEGIAIQTSAAEEIYIKIGETGTAVKTSGANITPENLNAGSGKVASVLCYSNVSDGAVDITGLTGGAVVEKLWLTSAATTSFNFEQHIIIPKNQTFSIYCVGGDTLLRGTVVFNFHD